MPAKSSARKMQRVKWLLICFCFAALAGHAQVALLLKNGDRVSGKVISEDTNQVVIATSWGTQTLPLSLIDKRIDLPAPVATNNAAALVTTNAPSLVATNAPVVIVTNAPVVTGTNTPALASTNAPVVVSTNAPVLAATNAPVVAPTNAPTLAATNAPPPAKMLPAPPSTPIAAKKPKLWNFDVQVGVNLQVNQVESETYNGVFRANYAGPLLRHIISYNGSYGRSDGVVSANQMNGNIRTEYDFSAKKRAFLFNATGIGYDAVRKVDLTYDESAGVGYKFLTLPKFSLTGDFGLNYQKQYFSDGTAPDYLSLRLGETLGWCITPRLGVDQKAEFYPHVTHFGDYRVRLEINTTYKLNPAGNIYLNCSVIDIYDTAPAQGVTPNDLQVRSTIGLKF